VSTTEVNGGSDAERSEFHRGTRCVAEASLSSCSAAPCEPRDLNLKRNENDEGKNRNKGLYKIWKLTSARFATERFDDQADAKPGCQANGFGRSTSRGAPLPGVYGWVFAFL
jgi:hypothetical protein